MNPLFEDLLKKSWIKTLLIYRLWGNASLISSLGISYEDLMTANCHWEAYKYFDESRSWMRFKKVYDAAEGIPLETLINLVGRLDRDNYSILKKQSKIFNVPEYCLHTIFDILFSNSWLDESKLEKKIKVSFPNLPFVFNTEKQVKISIF